jgi:copper(I)-binding protein
MLRPPLSALLAAMMAIAGAALADEIGIHTVDAHARPTPPGITMGEVDLVLMNHGSADDALTGASSPVAESAGLYRNAAGDGAAPAAMPSLTIKANDGVAFKPEGPHILLIGLKQSLKPGDSFPLTLIFTHAGAVDITVMVQPLTPVKRSMPGMKM